MHTCIEQSLSEGTPATSASFPAKITRAPEKKKEKEEKGKGKGKRRRRRRRGGSVRSNRDKQASRKRFNTGDETGLDGWDYLAPCGGQQNGFLLGKRDKNKREGGLLP